MTADRTTDGLPICDKFHEPRAKEVGCIRRAIGIRFARVSRPSRETHPPTIQRSFRDSRDSPGLTVRGSDGNNRRMSDHPTVNRAFSVRVELRLILRAAHYTGGIPNRSSATDVTIGPIGISVVVPPN